MTRERRWGIRAALLLFVLLAFGLRVYELADQSFWSDEGLSLYRARRPVTEILTNQIVIDGVTTQDTNPPLYFLLLHGWRALSGETVFALRFLGVILALPAIPTIYFLGRIALGWRVGLVAALLLAISPFHVWQSQVLRNYGLLLTVNLLSVSALLYFLMLPADSDRGRWRWLFLWFFAALVGSYTHYFGFFLLAFGLMALFGFKLQEWRAAQLLLAPRWIWFVLLLLAVLLLPVLWVALTRFLAGGQIDFYTVPVQTVVRHALSAFSVGMSRTLAHPWWRLLPGVFLLVIGLPLAWRKRPMAFAFLLGYLLVPLSLLLLLSQLNPLYNGSRHLLIGLPPFLIVVAAALVLPSLTSKSKVRAAAAVAIWAAGLLLVGTQLLWLRAQFRDPALVRDDIEGVATYLNQVVEPEDLIVLHDTIIGLTFDYYYQGSATVISVPLLGEQDQDQAVARLAAAGDTAERVWFLAKPEPRTGFPRKVVAEWADEHWPRFLDQYFGWMWLPVQLEAYTPRAVQAGLPEDLVPLGATFGDALTVHGIGQMKPVQQAGTPLLTTFYLSRPASVVDDYLISLELRDEAGRSWTQFDQSLWPDYPPPAWPAKEVVRYDHVARLPAGLPPGHYQLWLRILGDGGGPLPLADGQVHLRLFDLEVTAAPCTAARPTWSPHEPRRARFGTDLTLVGVSPLPEETRPGFSVETKFLWCVQRQPEQNYEVRLQLVDERGEVVAESVSAFTRAGLETSELQAGQLILSQAGLPVPATAAPVPHRLRLSLLPAGGGRPLAVNWLWNGRDLSVGRVNVTSWPLETDFPPIAVLLDARFGTPPLIELHGYELSGELSPGEIASLKLFLRAAATIPDDFRLFVHLASADETIVAQVDGVPAGGLRPTTSWRPGEVIVDERTLSLPQGVPPGRYHLWVGFYNLESGQRLPIFVDGELQADDRLLLASPEVLP